MEVDGFNFCFVGGFFLRKIRAKSIIFLHYNLTFMHLTDTFIQIDL